MKKLLLFSAFLLFTFFLSVMNTSSQVHLRQIDAKNYDAGNNYNNSILADNSPIIRAKQNN